MSMGGVRHKDVCALPANKRRHAQYLAAQLGPFFDVIIIRISSRSGVTWNSYKDIVHRSVLKLRCATDLEGT